MKIDHRFLLHYRGSASNRPPAWPQLLFLAAAALCLAVSGCASNSAYRTSLSPCDTAQSTAPCPHADIETGNGYQLGFVEFDDQGWFWNRQQLTNVEHLITSSACAAPGEKPKGTVILLFVHGWKNNAEYDNDNVKMFRTNLTYLSKAEQIAHPNQPRNIVGVYVGWRGLSAKMEPFKELSFWERKNTAETIGYGAMTELLLDLEQTQQACNKTNGPGAPRTEFIIVGHSFGGAAVYSAISQIVTERFVANMNQGLPARPLGDMVLLLNPALEASRHYNLNQLATSMSEYPPTQRPVLAIFTSVGDWATHYAFPVGRWFSTSLQKYRGDLPQRDADRDALGWFGPFVTHDLVYTNGSNQTTLNATDNTHKLHGPQALARSIQNVRVQRAIWRPNAERPKLYHFDDCDLVPRETYRPGNPFMVVSVDKRIMSGHTDIGNPVIVNFLREFIGFCEKDP